MVSKINWLTSDPEIIAPQMDARQIHLWRFSYNKRQRHQPFFQLLSAYARQAIDDTCFRHNDYGKPFFKFPRLQHMTFNWSHSQQTAVMAIALEPVCIGVDIEHVSRRRPYQALAQRYFTRNEQKILADLDDAAAQKYFIRLWNGKEALLKAYGRGIAYGLDQIDIQCVDDQIRIETLKGAIALKKPWHIMQQVIEPAGYVALAWSGAQRDVRCFTWNHDSQ